MDFAENFESYKSLHEDAYTVMCASIDFSKFKDQMLKFKLVNQTEEVKDIKGNNFGVEGGDKFWQLAAEDFNDPNLNWSKVIDMKHEKDGYSGYAWRRPLTTGSATSMMMTEMRYIGVKKAHFLEMLKNGPPTNNVKEMKILNQTDEHNKDIYIRMKMGGFISDRDNVVRKTVKDLGDGNTLMTIESVDLGIPEVAGVQRMEMFKTMKIREDPDKPDDLLVTDYSNFDMKGYFPTRIMNMVISSILPKMEKEMRQKLRDVE